MGAVPPVRRRSNLAWNRYLLDHIHRQWAYRDLPGAPRQLVQSLQLERVAQVPLPRKDLMASSADAAPGYHGKLPAKGDFVTRRLPRGFLDPWDGWLQDAIGGSRARRGEGWLDAYLTSPIWRFALSARLCGEAAVAGVAMPSVDRVGRYFPLTIAALPGGGGGLLAVPVSAAAWFDKAEELVQSALADAFDFDGFDSQVAALGPPATGEAGPGGAAPAVGTRLGPG